MIVRQANLQDLEQLCVLFDGYRVFYKKESDTATAKAFLQSRIEEESSTIFVVENKSKVLLAFTQLYPIFSSTQMKRFWLLNDLFVSVESRGIGLSKMLIERVKVFCKETEAAGFYLETEASNTIGNRLYERVGMQLDQEHNYFSWTIK